MCAQLVGRAEHADAVDAQVLLARVVVDQADRRVAELAVALHLPDHELARVAGADDQHLLAARDEPTGARALDHAAREQPRAGDSASRSSQSITATERGSRTCATGEKK